MISCVSAIGKRYDIECAGVGDNSSSHHKYASIFYLKFFYLGERKQCKWERLFQR